jgi:DNA invertase Pin-like site-specific DNA recombinase
MNIKEQKLIFAPLIRVSTEAQKKRGESLNTQHTQLDNAISMLGGNVFRWYSGQEHATAEQERKILEELIRDAEEKRFNAVILCDMSRWSRDNQR